MVAANPAPATYAEAIKTLRLLKDNNAAAALLRYARGRYPKSRELQDLGLAG